MPLRYARIIAHVSRMPIAMMPEKIAAVREFLLLQANGVKFSPDEIAERIGRAPKALDPEAPRAARDSTVARQPGSVAVLNLFGIMEQHAHLVDDISGPGGTSTDRFKSRFRAAAADPNVKAIVINIDSPGGSVYGVAELAAVIREEVAKKAKPVVAQVNSLAASAAYYVASAAGEIVATPSGEVGSIGVYTIHDNYAKALEMKGIAPTIVKAGKYKIEDNPFEALGEAARAHLQSIVDEYYDTFVADVAKGRSQATGAKVTALQVRNGYGEGRVLTARAALAEGMIDRIATLDETLARFGAAPASAPKPSAAAEAPLKAADYATDAMFRREADGRVHVLAPWPEKTTIAAALLDDPRADALARDGDQVRVTCANGSALYARDGVDAAGDWLCRLVESTYTSAPLTVAQLKRELDLIALS